MIPRRLKQVVSVTQRGQTSPPALPASLVPFLPVRLEGQFRMLPVVDQIHLIGVAQLVQRAHGDDDTVIAALVHDIGKACQACSIHLWQRTAHVVLNAATPSLYRKWSSAFTEHDRTRGLFILAHHAERGATAAALAGCSPRVQWLIRHHECKQHDDAQLRLLQKADDEECVRSKAIA